MAKTAILFADNDPDFLNTRTEFLENAGYRVLKAYTLKQARQLLTEAHVHLAILDIRMVDDDDEKDTSGLTLARDPTYRSAPKIILTNFPTYQDVRAALGPVVDGLPPAVDFLAKREGPEAMIQAVERALARHVRINQDLQIHWDQQEPLSFLHLVNLLSSDLSNEVLTHWAGELEDLVRRLFYEYRHIRIGRLLWHHDRRLCVPVLAQSSQGATDSRILVCGEREQLVQESERMRELAPETTEGTKWVSTKKTIHLGATIYRLPNADIETVQPLREMFRRGKERPLKTAIGYLLKEVLGTWHQRGQTLEETHGLMSLYRQWVGLERDGLSQTEVERRANALIQAVRPLSAVEIEHSNGLITFHFPNLEPVTCPDPIATLYTPLERYGPPVVCRLSPGRLTADNILVDARRQAWLTDFACAGQAPQWWDFVCLEAVIRFDLSQAPDLMAWQEFEECLVRPARLFDRLKERDVISDLKTSVVLIEQIRRQAGSETGPDPLPYYAGLLAWTVGALVGYNLDGFYTQVERMRMAHLIMASAMLARRLRETFPLPQAGSTLRLDEKGSLWIGEHRINDLSGQELALLRCLYERRGQLVGRQVVVESVFREPYQPGDDLQESRINSLIRRLRVKIEPNPNRPRYILTVKGKGYRLQVGHQSDA